MTLNTSEVLDLSKENVQPLRQGRKAAHLKTALQAQTDPETQYRLLKQREEFEYMIRMYEGDDPLQSYWEYVAWLEQSFTKLGRESNLILLLEDAILKFKDIDKYKQDQRFVQLLIKYISVQSNSLELFQSSYNLGLGTMCSAFYKAWAEELDKNNDFKRADQIYQLGLHCRAQPLEELQNAHIQFQLSIARKMIEGNINNNEQNNENTRSALSKLQPSKVKSSRMSKDTAGIFQLSGRNSDSKNNVTSSGKFKIYQEDENDENMKSEFKNKNDKLPKGSIAERENIMKASKWNVHKQKQNPSFKPSLPTTPSFQIHEDPDAAYENVKTVIRPRALKSRREEFKCPVAIFGEPDPSKKPMYPKHLVYVGGRDIQLEELRAAIYWKNVNKERQDKEVFVPDTSSVSEELPIKLPTQLDKKEEIKTEQTNSILETCSKNVLNDANNFASNKPPSHERVGIKNESLLVDNSQKKISIADVNREVSENGVLDLSDKKVETKMNSMNSLHETSHKNVSTDADPLVGLFEKGGSAAHYSPSTSITVNTRTAWNVIQTMWASPLPPSAAKGPKSNSDFDDSKFKVPSSPLINRQAQKKLSFPVFCDEESKPSRQSEKFSFPVFCDEMPATSTQKPGNLKTLPSSKTSFSLFADDLPVASAKKQDSPKSTITDGFSFPMFTDDVFPSSIQKVENSKSSTASKIPFPVFLDDTSDIPQKKESSRTTTDTKFTFPVFTDEIPATSTQKPESLKTSSTNKLSFPIFSDEMPASSTQKPKSPMNSNKFSFPIFSDDGIMPLTEQRNEAKENQIEKKLLFPVDSDEDIPNNSIPFIVPVNLADTPLEPENKENFAPKSYATPTERRPLSGYLTPATDIPTKPLDYEDSEDDDDYYKMIPKNDFDEETCSTKAFAITLPSSTPFSRSRNTSPRKSLLYNGSFIFEDNTVKNPTENSKYAKEQQLSLILENSKEQGSNSSGGSSAMNK